MTTQYTLPLAELFTTDGPKHPNGYIVSLHDQDHAEGIIQGVGLDRNTIIDLGGHAFCGFACEADDTKLSALRSHPHVEAVYEDAEVDVGDPPSEERDVVAGNAPWGLQRISSVPSMKGDDPYLVTYHYTYNPRLLGKKVEVFVLDTGIDIYHPEFTGRARWGANFVPDTEDKDVKGHGTHCAGTIIGIRVGVAREAEAIAVKVLGDKGRGRTSYVIQGLNWVLEHRQRHGSSVVSMSLGGHKSAALDKAVIKVFDSGVHVVVSAGNKHDLAEKYSPAGVKQIVTVGATNIDDVFAKFSNYGSSVDLLAPGVVVYSAWPNQRYRYLNGTSMSCPHVSGIIAAFLEQGPVSPPRMKQLLLSITLKGVITGVPPDTPNLLAQNFR